MKITILSPGEGLRSQYLTSFLVNDRVAIDAGCVGFHGDPRDQARIGHVFLSHTHADHVGSLPMFLENAEDRRIALYGHPEVLDSVHRDIFNGRVWPDLMRESRRNGRRLELVPLAAERPVRVEGLTVTPVPVNHTVPTFGFIVEDETSAAVFGSDTGPTERIWELAGAKARVKAVFLEASFPNSREEFALATGHLAPDLFRAEAEKLPGDAALIAVHIKPRYRDQVVAELLSLHLPRLRIGEPGAVYAW